MRTRRILCSGVVLAALALAGCGSTGGGQAAGGGSAGVSTSTTGATSSGAPSGTTTTAPPATGAPAGGGGASSGGGGAPGAGGGQGGVMQPVPGNGPAVPKSRVDASAVPTGMPGQVWTQDNGTYVGLVVEQSGCQQLSAQAISQTSTTVVIQVITTVTSGHMCPDYVRNVPIGARLSAPLGDRTIQLQAVTRHS